MAVIDSSTPFQCLPCPRFLPREQLLVKYLDQVLREAAKLNLFQNTEESPGLFLMLLSLLRDQSACQHAKTAGLTSEEWRNLLLYALNVFTHKGNRVHRTKLVPSLMREKLERFIRQSGSPIALRIWLKIADAVYSALPPSEQTVRQTLSNEYPNSRVRNMPQGKQRALFCIKGHVQPTVDTNETVVTGECSFILERVVRNLAQALPYAQSPEEQQVLINYMQFFTTGDSAYHKEALRHWLPLNHTVEWHFGFTPTSKVTGFIGVRLPDDLAARITLSLPKLQKLLPWTHLFSHPCQDTADFSLLQLVGFEATEVPYGLSLPEYSELRGVCRSKTFFFTKTKATLERLPGLREEDWVLLQNAEYERVMVAIHEVVGHASTPILPEGQTVVLPWSGQLATACSRKGQSWAELCGKSSQAIEECLAEAIVLFLTALQSSLKAVAVACPELVRRAVWLSTLYSGLRGLADYDPALGEWSSPHSQAWWVLVRLMMDAGLASVDWSGPYFQVQYKSIPTLGLSAISLFLTKLHVFKCLSNSTEAVAFFLQYSAVNELGMRLRECFIQDPSLNLCMIQCNTQLSCEYSATLEGAVAAYLGRFHHDEELLNFWERERG